MREVVDVMLAVVASGALAVALASGLAIRRVRRANRLAPWSRSEAPAHWLWSLGRPAQLHRRLRRATRMVIAATQAQAPPSRLLRSRRPADGGVLEGVGRELVRRAVALDAGVVACDRGGSSWRRRRLAEITREVGALELSAARLAALSIDLRRHLDQAGPPSTVDVDGDLDALEAAIGELRHAQSPGRVDGSTAPPVTS